MLLFSWQVVSDSLQPHGLQHARPPCPSPTPVELAQTHVHQVGDAIQPSLPLRPSFPFAFNLSWVSLVAQLVKHLPDLQETWVQSLGWEDPLEKGKATHSSILAWRIPWTTVHGVTKSWTRLSHFHCQQCRRPWFKSWVGKICWRRHRPSTPVFLGFPCGSAGKESACNAGDLGSIPALGRSPGEGKG